MYRQGFREHNISLSRMQFEDQTTGPFAKLNKLWNVKRIDNQNKYFIEVDPNIYQEFKPACFEASAFHPRNEDAAKIKSNLNKFNQENRSEQ